MVVNCPNCGKENKNTNIKCEFCSIQLIDENRINQQNNFFVNENDVETKEINVSPKTVGCLGKILSLIFIGPWLLIGIAFLGIGLFSIISEHNQAKGYEETTGILIDYDNCTYEDGDELCEAIYEYQVNGVTYTVSPNLLSDPDSFAERNTVYYNPNNPSESIMYSSWNIITIIGLIIIIVIIVTSILKKKKMKKILKGEENIIVKV